MFASSSSLAGEGPVRVIAREPGRRLAAWSAAARVILPPGPMPEPVRADGRCAAVPG